MMDSGIPGKQVSVHVMHPKRGSAARALTHFFTVGFQTIQIIFCTLIDNSNYNIVWILCLGKQVNNCLSATRTIWICLRATINEHYGILSQTKDTDVPHNFVPRNEGIDTKIFPSPFIMGGRGRCCGRPSGWPSTLCQSCPLKTRAVIFFVQAVQ